MRLRQAVSRYGVGTRAVYSHPTCPYRDCGQEEGEESQEEETGKEFHEEGREVRKKGTAQRATERRSVRMALSLIASGYGREPLVHQPGIVHPEGIARTAHIGTTVARRELQDEVSGRFGR